MNDFYRDELKSNFNIGNLSVKANYTFKEDIVLTGIIPSNRPIGSINEQKTVTKKFTKGTTITYTVPPPLPRIFGSNHVSPPISFMSKGGIRANGDYYFGKVIYTIPNKNTIKPFGKYEITRDTQLLRWHKTKKDVLGDAISVIVKQLKKGDIIDVVRKGSGGRGIIATPYLILADETYIVGFNAKKVDDSTTKTTIKKLGDINKKYLTAKNILIGAVVGLAFIGLVKII